jgi:hypothetical protein
MLHLRLAEIAGTLDIDQVADGLTREQLLEWWAYGMLRGWFIDPDAGKQGGMTAEESKNFFERLTHGRNNHP